MAEPASELEVLRAENKLMRLLLRDVELYGQAFEYQPTGGERMVLSPADVRVVMRYDAVTMYEAALKVVRAAETWRDDLAASRALAEAVDEWRASRG